MAGVAAGRVGLMNLRALDRTAPPPPLRTDGSMVSRTADTSLSGSWFEASESKGSANPRMRLLGQHSSSQRMGLYIRASRDAVKAVSPSLGSPEGRLHAWFSEFYDDPRPLQEAWARTASDDERTALRITKIGKVRRCTGCSGFQSGWAGDHFAQVLLQPQY